MKNFDYYITKYFSEYLPSIRNLSYNTIKSYRDTFIQFLLFIEKNNKSKKIEISDITQETVENFILLLRNEKKLCSATCNQRLAAIQSFFKYLKIRELSYYEQCNKILSIGYQKKLEPVVEYLTLDEIKYLLEEPKVKDTLEFRDLAILCTLYDTGARVQEICDLKLNSINFKEKVTTIILNGKGNKNRVVPISNNVSNILNLYIKKVKIQNDDFLFKNIHGQKFTRVGIQYVLDKYIKRVRKKYPTLYNKKISNHTLRHSKAMHLLEAGVNIVNIRDILGHTSITTTEIYAKCSTRLKENDLKKNELDINVTDKYDDNLKSELTDWLKENI